MAAVVPRLSLDPSTTKALLIGVSDYAFLSPIAPAVKNLNGIQLALENQAILGLPAENIIRVENQRHDEIFDAIANFVEDKNNLNTHTLILYFCGHGLRKSVKDKELLLSGINTKKSRLNTTGIRFADIKQQLENSHLQSRLLILDTCYSGLAAMDEEGSILTDQEATIKGTYVLASAGEDEKAYFDTDATYTFFTEALLQVMENGIAERQPFLTLEQVYQELQANYQHATPKRIDNLSTRPFYFLRNNGLKAEKIWEETQQENTAKAFAAYLESFPEGPYLEEALWGYAVLLQQPEGYQRYVTHFPEGKYAFLAKEEQSWLKARATNTIDAWLHFVRGFHQIENDRTERRVEEALDHISRLGKNTRLDVNQRNQLKAKIGELRQEIAQLKQERTALLQQLSEQAAATEQSQLKLKALAEDLNQAEEKLSAYEFEAKAWTQEKQSLRRQVQVLQQQSEQLPQNPPQSSSTFDFPPPKMLPIPGGSFLMGSSEGEGDSAERPQHTVAVPDFFLAETPVTVAQYLAFCKATDSHWPEWLEARSPYNVRTGSENHYKLIGDALSSPDRPIVGVSWHNAMAYAEWLSEETGQAYRLPSEAEWEYAAGGAAEDRTKWAGINEDTKLREYAWYNENSSNQPQPIGTKLPNALGLRDMSGNVSEWCQDAWHDNYQGAPKDGSAWEAKVGDFRVIRGGSWINGAVGCRVANRDCGRPDVRYNDLGFRLARI